MIYEKNEKQRRESDFFLIELSTVMDSKYIKILVAKEYK